MNMAVVKCFLEIEGWDFCFSGVVEFFFFSVESGMWRVEFCFHRLRGGIFFSEIEGWGFLFQWGGGIFVLVEGEIFFLTTDKF